MNQNKEIEAAVEALKNGGIILCPSDTVYSLSCDATNENAVEKLRLLKKRSKGDGFVVLVNNDRLVNQCYKDIPAVAWDMIDLSASPLSIIMEDGRTVCDGVRNYDGSLAMRMVKKGFVNQLLNRLRKPIVSTSANTDEEPIAQSFELIDEVFKQAADFVVSESSSVEMTGIPSKMVRLKNNGEVSILRK